MATPTSNNFTNFSNLGLTDTLGIQFSGRTSDPADSDLAAGRLAYRSDTNTLRLYNGTAWQTINIGAGGGGIGSFEDLFNLDNALDLTTTVFTINQSGNVGALALNKSGVGAGTVLAITNSGSGKDIANSTNWSIAASGGVGVLELGSTGTINATGGALTIGSAGTTTTFAGAVTSTTGNMLLSSGNLTLTSGNLVLTSGNVTVTLGDVTVTDGDVSFTSTDNNVAGLAVVNNTLTTYGAGGVSTGMVQIKSTSVTTGTLLQIQSTEANLTTGFYLSCFDVTANSSVFSIAKTGVVIIAGSADTASLTLTIGNVVVSDGTLSVTDDTNGASFSVTNNTATTATPFVFAGSGTFTGNTTSSFMTLTASGLTSGTVLYAPAALLTTGKVLNAPTNALTTGTVINLSSTSNVLTSGSFITATWNPSAVTSVSSGILVSIVDSPTINATVAATQNDIAVVRTNTTAAAAITYTPSGSLVLINNASPTIGAGSTLTDSAIVLDIQQNNATSTGTALSVVDVKGAGTGNVAVNVVANSLTTSTGAVSITANGLTTGKGLLVTSSGTIITTGSLVSLVANSATSSTGVFRLSTTSLAAGFSAQITGGGVNISTGGILDLEMGAATLGAGIKLVTSGAYTDVGLINVAANSLTTTGVGLLISNTGTGLTSGSLISVTCGSTSAVATNGIVSLVATGAYTSTSNVGLLTLVANSTTAGTVMSVFGNGLTTGVAALFSGSGVYTGTGFFQITQSGATTGTVALLTANAVTTGNLLSLSGTGMTTGTGVLVTATAATLTTGAYFRANDGGVNVFAVGLNGHIQSRQTTAPTIAVTVQNGITAAAVTAGSTDTCGIFTTTGTSTGSTTITVTFNKAYAVAPEVILLPANTAATVGVTSATTAQAFVSSTTTTTFVVTIPAGAVYAATPSYRWVCIEHG